MDQELEQKIDELVAAFAQFQKEHPEEYAKAEQEFLARLETALAAVKNSGM